MTPTQKHLLKLLLEIDDICKKHNIEYFLEYGTILGGVRHEGFIPWDNDLDISMTEDNYDKFVEACRTELDHKTRTFCDNRINREFPTVFGHYVDLESCRMSNRTTFWDNLCGQCIDIFCLIELPGEAEAKQKAIDRFFAYDEYCNTSFMHYHMKTDEVFNLYRQYQEREKEIGRENVLKELEAEIFGHHYEDCDTYLAGSARVGNPGALNPKKVYDHYKEVQFEGHVFHVPGDYVESLTLYYGDNFHLFPKDLRIHTEMSHTGVPCRAYVDDFMRLLDKDEMLRERKTFKDLGIEEGHRLTKIKQKFYQALGLKVNWSLQQKIKKENLDVKALVAGGTPEDLDKLDKLFTEYFNKQLHSDVLYWRVHFDIGDDLEYAAMYTLLMKRNNRRGIDLLFRLRGQNNLPLTEDMKHMRDTVQHIRNIKKYMMYGEYQKTKENLDWCLEHFSESKEIRLWDMRYQVEMAETEADCRKCEALINEMLSRYPQDDYCRKAQGDILWKLGDKDKAREIYAQLKETTNDGLILLDIRKKEEFA